MYGSFGTDERKRSKAIILLTPEEIFSFPPKDAVVKAKKCKTSVIATCLPCGVAAGLLPASAPLKKRTPLHVQVMRTNRSHAATSPGDNIAKPQRNMPLNSPS